MPDYRRLFVPGGTYFFTVVTYQRRRILAGTMARDALREAFASARRDRPFEVEAVVLLPIAVEAKPEAMV